MTEKKVTKGNFEGYCACGMMLMEQDSRQPGFKCPSCAKYNKEPLTVRPKK